MPKPNKMIFRRFGRSYHLNIQTAKNLEQILILDEALWVATGAPLKSLNCDQTFLKMVDSDSNGRIMCFETKEAILWLLDNLQDRDGITAHSKTLSIKAINVKTDDGKRVALTTKKILSQLGVPESEEITLDQIRKIKDRAETASGGEAGVVLPQSADSANVKQFIDDIIDTVGGLPHPNGGIGINKEKLDEFLELSKAYLAWQAKSVLPDNQTRSDIMPLGKSTHEAFKIYTDLKEKFDQYFTQCALISLDPRAAKYVGTGEEEFQTENLNNPSTIEELMKQAPLSPPRSDRSFFCGRTTNPVYSDQLDLFMKQVANPIFKRTPKTLTDQDWETIKETFSAYNSWLTEKTGAPVEKLGTKKLETYTQKKLVHTIQGLIEESHRKALAFDNIRLVEKLILYQANMLSFVNNFVSFPYLYDPAQRAMFEMGTLILDGRHFNFSVQTDNRQNHSSVAKTSNIFIIYAEISPGETNEKDSVAAKAKYEVAIPVTSGGKGNLCVGKHGVFHDVNGNEYDARIIQMIENPISLREALVSPFQRLGKLLSGKIEAMTASAEKKLDTAASGAMKEMPTRAPSSQTAPQSKGLLAGGLLMGGGVAIAALGSAFAYIGKTLAGVGPIKIILGILIAVLAVAVPVAIMALLKLRSRDLSALLEGCGWAINARMRLTFRQARMFTQQPMYPDTVAGVIYRCMMFIILTAVIIMEAVIIGQHIKGF
ncbi:hypothetical protein ACFLS1_05165 [Verrucomicrobiota bacterium]